jgi:hypothetical protein
VADVERKAEELGQRGGHAEEEAERDAAADAGGLPLDAAGQAGHARRAQALAEPVVLEPLGDAPVHHPVLEPAGDQARHPQQHAGVGGEQHGARAQRVERPITARRGGGVEERPPVDSFHSWSNRAMTRMTVATLPTAAANCDRLMRAMSRDQVGQAVRPGPIADGAGQRRRGHRRLLGRQREAEELDEEEAAGVQQRREHAVDERREVAPLDEELADRGAGGEHAAAGRRRHHLPVLAPRGGDVVLAGLAGALDDLAGHQPQVVAHELAERPFADQPGAQHLEQRAQLIAAQARRVGDRVEALEAAQAPLHGVEAVDQRHAHAGLLELVADVGDAGVAGRDQRDDLIGRGARQLVERRAAHRLARRARAHLLLQPERSQPAGDEAHRIGGGDPQRGPGLGAERGAQPLEQGLGVVGEPVEVALAPDHAAQRGGQVEVIGRLRQQPVRQPIGGLGPQPAVVGQADLGEQLDRRHVSEQRRQGRAQALLHRRQLLEREHQHGQPRQHRVRAARDLGPGEHEAGERLHGLQARGVRGAGLAARQEQPQLDERAIGGHAERCRERLARGHVGRGLDARHVGNVHGGRREATPARRAPVVR